MTGILGQLKWESLKKRRKDSRLILLYKGLKGKARIPTDDLIPKNRLCRNQHSLAFQIPSASKEAYIIIVILVIFAGHLSDSIKYFVRQNKNLLFLTDRPALFHFSMPLFRSHFRFL